MMSRLFGMRGVVDVIYQVKEFLPCHFDLIDGNVGDTKEFEGVIIQAAFDIIVLFTVNFDITFYPLKNLGMYIIGKLGGSHFYGYELRLFIFVLVESGGEFLISPFLLQCGAQLITYPVKQEYGNEQY